MVQQRLTEIQNQLTRRASEKRIVNLTLNGEDKENNSILEDLDKSVINSRQTAEKHKRSTIQSVL
jgi:hypothetical protein